MITNDDLQKIIKALSPEFNPIKKGIKTIKRDVAQSRSDIKVIISYFDSEYLELRKRIEKIEDHLNLDSKN